MGLGVHYRLGLVLLAAGYVSGDWRPAVWVLERLEPQAFGPPRLRVQARAANVRNAAGLLATALAGAGLVHLLAYHVPLGVPFGWRWIATALTLLAHCPLRGPLGLVATIAVLAPLLAFGELRRLERLNGALARVLAARHGSVPPAQEVVPRSPHLGASTTDWHENLMPKEGDAMAPV